MNRSDIPKLLIPFIGEPLSSDHQATGEKIKRLGVSFFIDRINWPNYPYQPIVKVYTGYSNTYLWLFYEVQRDFFRLEAFIDQEAVWEDSCVEFFMSTVAKEDHNRPAEEDIVYRNFEFNALGICLSACGTILDREMLTKGEMEQILRFPGLSMEDLPGEGEEFDWELCVAIPLNLIGLIPGSTFTGNFQKCGDLTCQPHYLTWTSIECASPEFHLPQFFGDIELVR